MAMTDYYQILEVSPDASDAEIRRSYRKLAFKWHPDKNKAEGAEEQFKKVQEAYEILGNPKEREQYDHSRDLEDFIARAQGTARSSGNTSQGAQQRYGPYSNSGARDQSANPSSGQSIEDFVARAERYLAVGSLNNATAMYEAARQFAANDPDPAITAKLKSMKGKIINHYSQRVELNTMAGQLQNATAMYEAARQFAANDPDPAITAKLESMRLRIYTAGRAAR